MPIEQFYQKPSTQEELVQSMKELRKISEDTTEPKVVVKLGASNESHKFVLMEDKNSRQYVIALPIEKKKFHRDIENFSRRLFQKNLNVIGGGYLHTDEEKLIVSGTSDSYGEAPKSLVKEILERKFPDVTIEAISLQDAKEEVKEYQLRKTLDALETPVQKELYADVLHKAVKLGSDYTKLPEQIAGREDLAYMIYSSENGATFGFDTLYLGYKNKNGEIQSKDVLRERGYIRGIQCDVQDTNVHFTYRVGEAEKELSVPLGGVEGFEAISNLSDTENQLLTIYQENQAVFKDAHVFHGTSL